MHLKRPTHILAIIAIGVGACWCFMTLFHPISRIWASGISDPIPWLGLFVIPMMIIPGAMAFCFGVGLLREVTKERIKGSVGALAVFGAFWAAVYIDKLLPERSNMLSLLLGAIVMIGAYVWISVLLFKSEKFKISGKKDFIGTGILTLLSFLIWLSLNEMLEQYYDEAALLGFLAPILIAWLFYKLTSKALLTKVVPVDIVNDEAAPHRDYSPRSALK
jgi:hypothetical protein